MSLWKRAGTLAGLFCAVTLWTSCGDYYRPIANPIVSPGGDPQPINYAFVLFTNPNGPNGTVGLGTIEQIDVSGDSVTLDATVGRNPTFAYMITAAANSGVANLIVANQDDGTLSNVEFVSQTITSNVTVTLPPTTSPVAFFGRSTITYALNATEAAVCPNGAVDALANDSVVTTTICVGKNPVSMVQQPSGGKVYVVNQGDATVSVIDPVSLQVIGTVPVGSNPSAIAVNQDGSYVFVANQGSNTLTAIHTADETTTSINVGTGPNSLFFDKVRTRLYVTNGGSNDVSVLDLSQTAPTVLVQHVALGAGAIDPTGLVPLADGSRYYVVNAGSNNVSVIDASSNTLSASTSANPISLGPVATPVPLSIESEPTSTKVYVTTAAPPVGQFPANNPNGAPGVTIIRTDTNAITNFLQAPQADPACQPNPISNTTCTYQTPLQILTYVR